MDDVNYIDIIFIISLGVSLIIALILDNKDEPDEEGDMDSCNDEYLSDLINKKDTNDDN